MNHKLFLFILLLVSISCNGGNQSEDKKTVYHFPNTSVINTIPQDCISKNDDQLINAASGLESFLLNTVSDEVTIKDENSYGKVFNDIFKKDMIFIKDNNLIHLQDILKNLTLYISRKDINYTISLVKNDSDINAWTHAGGYIYVTSGLMRFVNSDDELAFCIAHEIGHNENEHCKAIVQRLKTAENIGVSSDIAGMATDMYSSVFAAFNQPQEMESDLAGIYLAYKAGYDPLKSLDFFEKLSLNEVPESLDKFMRSHPFAYERSNCLGQYLKNSKE